MHLLDGLTRTRSLSSVVLFALLTDHLTRLTATRRGPRLRFAIITNWLAPRHARDTRHGLSLKSPALMLVFLVIPWCTCQDSVTLVGSLIRFAHRLPDSIDRHSAQSSSPLCYDCGLRRASVRVLAGTTNGNNPHAFACGLAICAPARTRTQND